MAATHSETYRLALPSPWPAPATSRVSAQRRTLRRSDPAPFAMMDFTEQTPWTIDAGAQVATALEEFHCFGAPALFVVRFGDVVGLLGPQDLVPLRTGCGPERRSLVDLATAVPDLPTMEWQTVAECTVRDLLEIFAGTGAPRLLVIEADSPSRARIRGLIDRVQLEAHMSSATHRRPRALEPTAAVHGTKPRLGGPDERHFDPENAHPAI